MCLQVGMPWSCCFRAIFPNGQLVRNFLAFALCIYTIFVSVVHIYATNIQLRITMCTIPRVFRFTTILHHVLFCRLSNAYKTDAYIMVLTTLFKCTHVCPGNSLLSFTDCACAYGPTAICNAGVPLLSGGKKEGACKRVGVITWSQIDVFKYFCWSYQWVFASTQLQTYRCRYCKIDTYIMILTILLKCTHVRPRNLLLSFTDCACAYRPTVICNVGVSLLSGGKKERVCKRVEVIAWSQIDMFRYFHWSYQWVVAST